MTNFRLISPDMVRGEDVMGGRSRWSRSDDERNGEGRVLYAVVGQGLAGESEAEKDDDNESDG